MRLAELVESVGGVVEPPALQRGDVEIDGVSLSSSSIDVGFLFAALPGHRTHGARFVSDAVSHGAAAILTDDFGREIIEAGGGAGVPVITVPDPRSALSHVASTLAGHPQDSISMVGITGTNGKTTVAHMVRAALEVNGVHCGVIGTLGSQFADRVSVPSARTTPEATDLFPILRTFKDAGAKAVVMEVSSIALCEHRVDGILFDSAVFTGLSHDHLDYHRDMEDYFAAKSRLFRPERARRGVVLVDDEWGARLAREARIPVTTVSARLSDDESNEGADWIVRRRGDELFLTGEMDVAFDVPISAGFAVANAALAIVTAHTVGVSLDVAAGAVSSATVPGRMELVSALGGIHFIVDYAHTPDAVEQVVRAAVAQCSRDSNRVIVVVGAGGDRDPHKRPGIGRAASLADITIITDDNPRSEDPQRIRSEVLAGTREGADVREVGSRREAIAGAVELALPGDVVLVLGKGHEATQERAEGLLAFDDRQVLAFFVGRRFGGGSREGVT
jgi:UDP-N-acetylmuramoyl-L-alanyl-D-glutamate--2,6-diaminopimelate ligase